MNFIILRNSSQRVPRPYCLYPRHVALGALSLVYHDPMGISLEIDAQPPERGIHKKIEKEGKKMTSSFYFFKSHSHLQTFFLAFPNFYQLLVRYGRRVIIILCPSKRIKPKDVMDVLSLSLTPYLCVIVAVENLKLFFQLFKI